ncbi:MAG: insulinase family protein [Chthonomonas sp.]|nr:insulinase family protein [Chthonomonas sp.]
MIHKFVLENGVRVMVEPNDNVSSAAIGIWCKSGSRHEHDNEAGITHFIEHMLFKGTKTRTAKGIAEEIEGRGGVLNAFTDKEQTCYYARVLSEEVGRATGVLTDMVQNSLLDPEEIARESGVIVEEIKRGEDEPGDHVHELHISGIWGTHPLGKPIIGTRESVTSFRQPDFRNYMERRYRGSNLVVAVAGKVDPEEFRRIAEQELGDAQPGGDDAVESRPVTNPGVDLIADDVNQVHFCIGADGAGIFDETDGYVQAIADSILGGGMSSRLFQEIREKRGLAYSVGTYGLRYSSGGAFTVYGGTGADTWGQVQELVDIELKKLAAGELDDDEVERCKRQLSGNMVLALEGMQSRMSRMARNEIHFQRDIPIEETLQKLRAVTKDQVIAYIGRQMAPEKLRTTAIGPFA